MAVAVDSPVRLAGRLDTDMSRWLWLVNWFLTIPHYLVIGLFVGGAAYLGYEACDWALQTPASGLIGLLVIVAAVVLIVTGRYPRGVFDLVLGLNRWAYRVVAYAALMTDRYPPFRLDMGEGEPAQAAVLDLGSGTLDVSAIHPVDPPEAGTAPAPPEIPRGRPMSAGRVVAVVLASLLGLGSLGLLAGGVTGLVLDQTQRDSASYLSTAAVRFESDSYAIVGSGLEIQTDVPDWLQVRSVTGEIQIRYDAGEDEVFVGLAGEAEATAYLADLGYDEVTRIASSDVIYLGHDGAAPVSDPAAQDFWSASASGSGDQTLTFEPEDGRWVVVAMNTDATAGVELTARVAAELPVLPWVSFVLIGAGGVGLLAASLIIYLAVRRPQLPDGVR